MTTQTLRPLFYSAALAFFFLPLTSCKTVHSGQSQIMGESLGASPTEITTPQIARFSVLLDVLDRDMLGRTPKDASDRLIASGARETAFKLQALGRVYESLDPKFTEIRKKFKKLEDGIGAYEKWVELLGKGQRSNAAPDVIAKLTKNRDEARLAMEAYLIATNFVPADVTAVAYNKTLRDFLATYKWHDAATDRQDVLNYLRTEIRNIKTAKWDFTHLEEGLGVHEFRRQMRWIPMETKALNGMVVLKPASVGCPIPIYENVVNDGVANSKYGVLPGSALETNPVTLTPCLYVQIAKLVDVVGAIKGNIEEVDNNSSAGEASDSVAPPDQIAVQKILDDTLATDLFGKLEAEYTQAAFVPADASRTGVNLQNAQNPAYCFNTQLLEAVKVTNVYTCSTHSDQKWDFVKLPSGFYSIKNAATNRCVNLKASVVGTETRGTDCGQSEDQSWKVVAIEGGFTQFESQRAPGLCLALNLPVKGSKTIVKACDVSDKAQLWTVK